MVKYFQFKKDSFGSLLSGVGALSLGFGGLVAACQTTEILQKVTKIEKIQIEQEEKLSVLRKDLETVKKIKQNERNKIIENTKTNLIKKINKGQSIQNLINSIPNSPDNVKTGEVYLNNSEVIFLNAKASYATGSNKGKEVNNNLEEIFENLEVKGLEE